MRKNLDLHGPELLKIWEEYTNGDFPLNDVPTKMFEVTGELYTKEHWHRTMTIYTLGIQYGSTASTQELLVARRRRSYENLKLGRVVKELTFHNMASEVIFDCLTQEITVPDYIPPAVIEEPVMHPVAIVSDIHYAGNKDWLRRLFEHVITTEPHEIILNGDIIQGYLRDSDMYNQTNDPIEQIKEFIEIVAPIINCSDVNTVTIIPGNHDEYRKSRKVTGPMNSSFAEVLAMILNGHIGADVRYTVEHKVLVGGETYKLIHGHGFKGEKGLQSYYAGQNIMYGHYHSFKAENSFICLPTAGESGDFSRFLGYPDDDHCEYVSIVNGDLILRRFK